ncbi:MAG: ISL3 family transposase [Acholeplasmatales bacterium]|nr:ISL3 family transposase [Acholeplasmatales bacterium]
MLNIEFFEKTNIKTDGIDLDKSYISFDSSTLNLIIELYLKKDNDIKCKYCASNNLTIRGSKKSKIKTSTLDSKNAIINLHRRIYRCNSCNKLTTEQNLLRTDGHRISIQKEIMILNALRDKTKTYSAVANEFDVSPSYVTNLFDVKVNLRRLKLPEVMCIDEVYLKKLVKRSYCFVIYAPQWRKIVDVLDSRRELDLIDYFSHISNEEKNNVKYVSMDLYEHYRNVIKKCFPNAKISADPFHVVKQLNNCFQKIRINTMKHYEFLKHEGHNYYWLYKKYWKFLLMDITNIKSEYFKVTKSGMILSKYQIIDNMLDLNPTLRLAYELKEEYRNFVSTATIDTAEDELLNLIKKFKASHINDYAPFINIMQKWFHEIINSFNKINNHKISNGPMERVNRDIKTLNGISFGATNFNRMRNRIMFTINEDAPISPYRRKNTNKMSGKPRGKYKKKK